MGPDQAVPAAPAGAAAPPVGRRVPRLGVRAPLVELCRERLRRTLGARMAFLFAAVTTLTFAVIAIAIRVADGSDASFAGLIVQAARVVTWGAGSAVALAAAVDRRAVDRAEGIDMLAAVRGMPAYALDAARALAAMVQTAVIIGVPVAILSVLGVILSGSVFVAARQAGVGVAVMLYAVVAGVVLGAVATAAGRYGGRRGRWVLLGVVVGPWIALDIAGRSTWSIPGALDALLELSVRLLSGARL